MTARYALALACLLPMLVPAAAADFPWDEARDVYHAGGEAVDAGGAIAVAYADAAGATANATYAEASVAARALTPDLAGPSCSLGPDTLGTLACEAGTVLDRVVERNVDNTLGAGDEARRIATVFVTSSAQQSARLASQAYGAVGGAFPP